MQTWNFNLSSASDVDILDTLVGYVRFYELTSGGGADPRIRLKSLGGGINVEVLAGQGYRLPVPVRGLVIENMSGVAITGKLAISPESVGGFEDDRITGTMSLDALTLAALEYVQVRPEGESGFFSDSSALVANTPLTVFNAAANPNGAILLSADMQFQAGDYAWQVFIAKATAPATVIDGAVLCASVIQALPASVFGGGHLPAPAFIPAGKGLYFISNFASAVAIANNRACRYKLL